SRRWRSVRKSSHAPTKPAPTIAHRRCRAEQRFKIRLCRIRSYAYSGTPFERHAVRAKGLAHSYLCWSFLTSSPVSRTRGLMEGRLLMTGNSGKRVLPPLPNSHHLRKQAKARLATMKAKVPGARLADAQLILAREYGFSNWAALQAEV